MPYLIFDGTAAEAIAFLVAKLLAPPSYRAGLRIPLEEF
jgi:uncharacterized glyoxalase superfamily protein PhnB